MSYRSNNTICANTKLLVSTKARKVPVERFFECCERCGWPDGVRKNVPPGRSFKGE